MRMYYSLRSFRTLKQDKEKAGAYQHFLQAGKSVGGIHQIQTVAEIMNSYKKVIPTL